MGNTKDEKNIEETLEVNEMLIDAIKAKLAILDDINWSNFNYYFQLIWTTIHVKVNILQYCMRNTNLHIDNN